MPKYFAYNISDSFIQYADNSQNIDEINYLFFPAFLEFCRVMEDWRLQCARPEIRRCGEYISHHLHNRITLDELNQISHLSPNYFSTLFLKELELRPLEYIRREKLNYAAFLFRNSGETISEVIAMLVFTSASAFTKQFEAQFCITPSEYKRKRLLSAY